MKRLFDIVVSFFLIIIFSPLFLILSLLIVLDSKGGVFFRGKRVGLDGKEFKIFKFRSMIPDCEGKGKYNISDKDERITKVGHFLRNSKLDELPQILNVFLGDMSFVGPRPELKVYTDLYTEDEKKILKVKPGITDWASITNFEQFKEFTQSDDPDEYYLKYIRPLKLKLQLYYYEHHSFFGDISCLIWTAYKVVTRSKKLPKNIQKIIDEYHKELGAKNEQ